ncbi:MAG: DNA gyrase subunit A [Anaerolineae bacterium]|nr:DNA gyrase subunit A [Anaerolineae bacterium]
MDIGTIQSVDIDQQMRSAYLDYAMSVIVARALPDARDGLKPVHRRILYAMHDMGIRANSSYKKSARIVGEVLGKYHPHGDMAVYDAMARMAQDFSMRYLLIDGQGNFGSIDGDAPAAMRYTEARLGALAEEILADIEKETVNFTANFDDSLEEPEVLPARLPNLLLNGASGIAVGMATNIPPHNLRELTAALIYMIDYYENMDEISIDDLIKLVPGPDFPTGGVIIGSEGIQAAYSGGKGRLVVRGKARITDVRGKPAINITEIPYQVNKSSLVERIAELVRDGRIDAISDLRDESDRNGMSIVIELKKNSQPQQVLNQLYKYTPLQSTFGVQMLALVEGEPRLLSLKRCLHIFLEHRQTIIVRRTEFELSKALARAHILEGLLIALANLDEVIDTIRKSPDADVAKERLVTRFKLTETQAQAILDMQLRRLAALERQKIEDEYQQLKERIAYLQDLLANPKKILGVIRDELSELSDKFGDDRRTHIAHDASEDFSEEDLIADEAVLVSITQQGYIKRVPLKTYRTTGRDRRGVTGQAMKGEDEVLLLVPARTLDTMLFFSDRGKVYSERVYQIPVGGRADRGSPVVNVIGMGSNERVTAAVTVPTFAAADYLIMATGKGRVKRAELSEFESVRASGMLAIGLDKDDELGWVRVTHGNDDVLLVTVRGQALRISETTVRAMGRAAGGVTGIALKGGDRLTSMEVCEPGSDLLVVTEKGYGKRASLDQYAVKGRATGGVATTDLKNKDRTGEIAAARVVQEDDEVTLISSNGMVLRLRVKDIPRAGRATRGVRLMNVAKGDQVASIARIVAIRIDEDEANGNGSAPTNNNGETDAPPSSQPPLLAPNGDQQSNGEERGRPQKDD